MYDIKEEFFRVGREQLDKEEKYMHNIAKESVLDFRWQKFIEHFIQSKEVLKFAQGKD